jgi:type III restriction enzyme
VIPPNDIFPLAEEIAQRLADDAESLRQGKPCALLETVTPVTSELLRYWFQQDYVDTRNPNFHVGQRDAILAIIYAHEVLGATSLLDLYEKVRPAAILSGILGDITGKRNQHPKYAAKMATGTGKTWVLNALLIWQYLNAMALPLDRRFTSNFLLVAPGLIVYDRLLDSFKGKHVPDSDRDFTTSDMWQQQQLFLPDNYRESVLGFVQTSTIEKQDIGKQSTGSGAIAISNWHLLAGLEAPEFLEEDEIESLGLDVDIAAVASSFIPLSPGRNAGNSLDVLDRRAARGEAMRWLKGLPSLLVFNDEAHHVHTSKKGDEDTEVEWQKSLNELAVSKPNRFVQVDFSATPYNESRGIKKWFPHIVVDFDLSAAMDSGLIKALVLDKRQEMAAIPNDDLEFRVIRDGDDIRLSEGQRTMLRAGLKRLEILEEQFEAQNATKFPKMLVMVEDTSVSPLVEDFLLEEGFASSDFTRIDSTRKAEVKDWDVVRDELFDIDNRSHPKVIISVLMLREGFDVNNICVIVPLRSAQSGILAEQTVGRGLRLMWRDEPAVEEQKAETRARLKKRQAPNNYYDVLFIVEHPRFQDLYEELLGVGLVGEVTDDTTRATGDSEVVTLRDHYEDYDFAVPFIVRDADEELETPRIDVSKLPVSTVPVDDLLGIVPSGDRFIAEDYATKTQFGAFTITGAKLDARGYNEYLAKLTNRVGGSISRSFTEKGNLKQNPAAETLLQVQRPLLLSWANQYIRTRFFSKDFDPLQGDQWRILMINEISDQIAGNLARALVESLKITITSEPEVIYRRISEVESLVVRSSFAVEVHKCVYPKLPIPSHSGGLERRFLEWADRDSAVEALVKIHEYKHAFIRRPYVKSDGMPALYSPDFLVRTAKSVYVVETKAQAFLSDANVQRKKIAAVTWCTQINDLPPELRGFREWHYVLVGEKSVDAWHDKGATVSELLAFAQLRPVGASTQLPLLDLPNLLA